VLVKILSFGCNWWKRFGRDPEDRFRYTRHAAFYNSTGVQCGNKIRRHWIIPGLIRFNGIGDFNPHYPSRSVGHTFSCTEPVFAFGGNRVVFETKVRKCADPDYFLVAVSSERFGVFDFHSRLWKSESAHAIAASDLRKKQEAMLLMSTDDWISSSLGRWRLRLTNDLAVGAILQLDEDGGNQS